MKKKESLKRECLALERKRQKSFLEQDKIIKKFEKINKKEFGGYSQLSLKGHLLGDFEKRESAKYPPLLKRRFLSLEKKRDKIVNQRSKIGCF